MIQVDGVTKALQVMGSEFREINCESRITFSNLEAFIKVKHLNILQSAFGIHFNPNTVNLIEFLKIVRELKPDYISINYSQINHKDSLSVRDEFLKKLYFVCDGIIADSDSESIWVESQIEEAVEWGCKFCVIDLFSDFEKGWKIFLLSEFEFSIEDLIKISTMYNVGVNSDYDFEDIVHLKNLIGSRITPVIKFEKEKVIDLSLSNDRISQIIKRLS